MKTAILMTWVIVISSFMFILYQTAYMIDEQNKRLNALHSEIQKIESDIAVLESEWSYLSRPERISHLAQQHLQVNVPYSAQLASYTHLTSWLQDSRIANSSEIQPIQAAFNE